MEPLLVLTAQQSNVLLYRPVPDLRTSWQGNDGELLAAMNLHLLIGDDVRSAEIADALEHRRVNRACRSVRCRGPQIGVESSITSTQALEAAPDAFLRCITERDLWLLIVQEIMLDLRRRQLSRCWEVARELGGTLPASSREETTSTTPWLFSERSEPETRSASTQGLPAALM